MMNRQAYKKVLDKRLKRLQSCEVLKWDTKTFKPYSCLLTCQLVSLESVTSLFGYFKVVKSGKLKSCEVWKVLKSWSAALSRPRKRLNYTRVHGWQVTIPVPPIYIIWSYIFTNFKTVNLINASYLIYYIHRLCAIIR